MKVKKRSGEVEEFVKEKIVTACQKAGATAEEGVMVAEDVANKIREGVSTKVIGEMVIKSLQKLNKKAAKSFEEFFRRKWGK